MYHKLIHSGDGVVIPGFPGSSFETFDDAYAAKAKSTGYFHEEKVVSPVIQQWVEAVTQTEPEAEPVKEEVPEVKDEPKPELPTTEEIIKQLPKVNTRLFSKKEVEIPNEESTITVKQTSEPTESEAS